MKKSFRKGSDNRSGVHIYLTNRWLYTLIFIAVILIAGVGVYAVTATSGVPNDGSAPNPGHSIYEIGAPSGCQNGQVLEYSLSNGVGNWTCGSSVQGSSVYTLAIGCSLGISSVLTPSSTCQTVIGIGGCSSYYLDCGGGCSSARTFPASCTNTFVGHLIT